MTPREVAMFEERIRILNRLVFAAEALDVPAAPEWPPWDKSPANAETIETEDPAELRALAVAWQYWASKLDDVLSEIGFDEDAIGGVVKKAKAARLALIALEEYHPVAALVGA